MIGKKMIGKKMIGKKMIGKKMSGKKMGDEGNQGNEGTVILSYQQFLRLCKSSSTGQSQKISRTAPAPGRGPFNLLLSSS
jgi:hypothetical protein